MSSSTATITLTEPGLEIRLWIARAYLGADGPGRTALEAAALALSWPAPPWQGEALAALAAATQEQRDATADLRLSKTAEERQAAQRDLRAARLAVANAEAALAATTPELRDPVAVGRWAMGQLQKAGVSPAAWSRNGDRLLAQWIDLLAPPVGDAGAALDFSLPPQAPSLSGGSSSPESGAETH